MIGINHSPNEKYPLKTSTKTKPITVAKTPEYSLLNTVFKENGIIEGLYNLRLGKNTGNPLAHVTYFSPNLRSKNRSSAYMMRS